MKKKVKKYADGGNMDLSALSSLAPLLTMIPGAAPFAPLLAVPGLVQGFIDKKKQDATVVSATPGNYNYGGPVGGPVQPMSQDTILPMRYPVESTYMAPAANPLLLMNSFMPAPMPVPTQPMAPLPYGAGGGNSSHSKSKDRFREMATGGQMDTPLSDNSFQVQGNPNVTDGNYYPQYNANLDDNEVVKDKFVFSNKLKNPKTGKSFAEEAKVIESSIGKSQKALKVNPHDELAKNTIKLNEQRSQALASVQESLAQLKGFRNNTQPQGYAAGGNMDGDPKLMLVSSGDLRTPDTYFDPSTNRFLTIDPINGSYKEAPFNSQWINANVEQIKQHELQNGNANWSMDYSQRKPLGDVNHPSTLAPELKDPWAGMQYAGGAWNEDYAMFGPSRDVNANKPASPSIGSTVGPPAYVPRESLLPGNAPGPGAVVPSNVSPGGVSRPSSTTARSRGTRRPTTTGIQGLPNGPLNPSNPYLDLLISGDTSKYSVDPMQPLNMLNRNTEFDDPNNPGFTTTGPSDIIPQVASNRSITAPVAPNISTTGTLGPITGSGTTSSLNGSKWVTGDYLQAAKVLSGFGQLIGGTEKESPNYDSTQITQSVYDPRQALNANQRDYKDALAGFDSPSINTGRSFANALYANKLGQNDQVISKYQQMNQQARSQYEQQTANQRRYNVGQTTYTNDVNARNRSAYKEAVDTAFTGLSNFGVGLNQKKQGYDTLNILKTMYPDVYAKIIGSLNGQ